MPSIELTNDEEALVTHVRGMTTQAGLAALEKVPDVDEVLRASYMGGMKVGALDMLRWLAAELNGRLLSMGPYDDTRTVGELLVAIGDKIREVAATNG